MASSPLTLKQNYRCVQSLHQFFTAGSYAVSSDGSFFVCVCVCNDTIKIVDSSNAAVKSTIEGDSEPVTAHILSPDDRFLFSTSHSRQIRLWDLSTLKCLRSWKGHEGPVMGMACQGGLLAIGGAGQKLEEDRLIVNRLLMEAEGVSFGSVGLWKHNGRSQGLMCPVLLLRASIRPPTDDELMGELEVKAAHMLETCAQTETIDKVVFTSSATVVIWKDHRLSDEVDEKNWSDINFCKKFKLWHRLSKTVAEQTAWALAMDGVNTVFINAGLLMQPDLSIKDPYLLVAPDMYKDGVFVTLDLKFLVNAHICVFEDSSSYGRLDDQRVYQQRIRNDKLKWWSSSPVNGSGWIWIWIWIQ